MESATAVDKNGITYIIRWSSEGSEDEINANRFAAFRILELRMKQGQLQVDHQNVIQSLTDPNSVTLTEVLP